MSPNYDKKIIDQGEGTDTGLYVHAFMFCTYVYQTFLTETDYGIQYGLHHMENGLHDYDVYANDVNIIFNEDQLADSNHELLEGY